MIKFLFFNFLFLWLITLSYAQDYGQVYIEKWKQFYPSQALEQGLHTSIFQFEDRSLESINDWVAYNKSMLALLENNTSSYVKLFPIDARLLKNQVRSEIYTWEQEKPHRHKLMLYTNLMERTVTPVQTADFLTANEKPRLLCQRLPLVEQLSLAARASLLQPDRSDLEKGLESLNEMLTFYQEELPGWYAEQRFSGTCEDFKERWRSTIYSIQSLIDHVNAELMPQAKAPSQILGRETYVRQLGLYTDSPLTPEELADMALTEIETTRKLMGEVAARYLTKQYPDKTLPKDLNSLIQLALDDMEKDAPKNGAEYLKFWQDLSTSAIQFIETNNIATLPEFQTLRIMSAPESAGPAARIGWVESAAPFDPNPVTTLYLPSIPESFPEQERVDFWSSFNKPFNRMIVIHELFPGHYMQIKVSRETAHPVRLLFPYKPYFEGWATFTEKVLLDAGWEKDNPLTLLAHLRKRMENANRAYTSVQVHCNGWTPDEVMAFSTETSLVAPQFAKSLWFRLMRSPMQLTSYFWGGQQFKALLAAEQERLGKDFDLQYFMDTIMRAGPIPIDEFTGIFSGSKR